MELLNKSKLLNGKFQFSMQELADAMSRHAHKTNAS